MAEVVALEHRWRGNVVQVFVDADTRLLTFIRATCPTGGVDWICEARGILQLPGKEERGVEGKALVDLRPFAILATLERDGAWSVPPDMLYLQCRWGALREQPERGVDRA